MYESEAEIEDGIEEIAMPWVHNDGGFSESGLTNRGRRKHGSPVVAAIAIAEQRRYSEVYYELRTLQWDFTMRARSKRKQEHSGDPHHGVFVEVFKPYLLARGWLWTPTMGVGTGVTMHLDYEEVPDLPLLIARISKSLVTVINGVAQYTHDPSRDGRRALYGYFQPR
jgi:hypothetical protein